MASGDLRTYLSLYADDFSHRGMDRAGWASWRMAAFEANPLTEVEISDLMLVADPEVADLYLSRFTQVMMTRNGPVTTTKRLYWKRSAGNNWQIVSEGSG